MVFDPESLVARWGEVAPWIVFGLILLAGLNVPISIDLLVTLSALIAARYLPEKVFLFFSLFTLGCIFSAWISYSLGRFFGRFVAPSRVEKMQKFYSRFGFLSFFICRFIPFGVRNLFFLSSGMSKVPFYRFALLDAAACLIWSSIFFFSIYRMGQNFDAILSFLKRFNLVVFGLFITASLSFVLYRFLKKRMSAGENSKDLL